MAKYFKRLPPDVRRQLEEELNGPRGSFTKLLYERQPPRSARFFANGQLQGHVAEERFLAIFENAKANGTWPPWLTSVARGTEEEDAMGIDMIACAGEHKIPIQIKSSFFGKKKFYERDDRRHIICIVVMPTMTDEDIFVAALGEISFVFEAIERAAAP